MDSLLNQSPHLLSLTVLLPYPPIIPLPSPLSLSPHLDDIEVIFYEDKVESSLQSSGGPAWSAKGRFGPNDVHHQYAIVFQTPPFYNLAVERPIQVMIALRRPSDSELSEPKPFLYLPQEFGECVSALSAGVEVLNCCWSLLLKLVYILS